MQKITASCWHVPWSSCWWRARCVQCTGVVTTTTARPLYTSTSRVPATERDTSYPHHHKIHCTYTTVAVTQHFMLDVKFIWKAAEKYLHLQKNICDYWLSWLLSWWRGELWRWWHHQEKCPCDDGDTVIMPAQPDQAEWGGLNIILLLPQWRSRISHQLSISLLRGPCPTAQSR